ncbi:MAG: hypothetical protein MK102_02445 [Fuerstiella sp.]|nr:hypothetical protein [Fuerstiella sp.]
MTSLLRLEAHCFTAEQRSAKREQAILPLPVSAQKLRCQPGIRHKQRFEDQTSLILTAVAEALLSEKLPIRQTEVTVAVRDS